ncbi:DUF342 domain-containing protein [Clostridium thermarum]|uniref:DUF342 domain-containing protein n=1 Tax=Clostridium thermarum TaxID=1716543 RepID=UPI0013D336A6|nr:DUF342 domain-containing protein [Clostridium thermarum]
MDNDKLFDFMSKMYNEMQQGFKNMQNDITEVKSEINDMKEDIKEVKKEINNIYMKIDGDINNRLKALEDGYKVNYELTVVLRDRVEQITDSINDMNLTITDMKEDINYIAGKTIRQQNK